jgi:hypothetical protein
MNAIISFVIGFLLAKIVNYIGTKRNLKNTEVTKTLNIGAGTDEIINVTPGTIVIEIESASELQKINLEDIDNVIFYVSGTNKYILYKNNDFRYVKLDIPVGGYYE